MVNFISKYKIKIRVISVEIKIILNVYFNTKCTVNATDFLI